ncbi:TadE/TadG family type IV pilus assembly protein [Arthrobacter sp. MPF02]|uniref:TadE/TadG family type IV pilus assembly protein n=1 Tax=Arthrobacter sp. MPF02 TaxID=3388492 RepID=UPI0039846A00
MNNHGSPRSFKVSNDGIGCAGDKGAVAVEFALVLPIFLILVLGIFEFGRALNIQVSLSEAARESTRYVAVHHGDAGFSVGAAQSAGVAAAPSVPLKTSDVTISYSSGSACATGVNVISTVRYSAGFMTGLEKLIGVSQPFTIAGKGVMRCGG